MEWPDKILDASKRIKPYVRKTYLNRSHYFSELVSGDVWFKLENHQVTGSFKARGAVNKLLSLSSEKKKEGIISASTGNHGAAVAYAAKQLNISCTIYVPEDASSAKLKNMENYDASIKVFGHDCVEAEKKARAESSLTRKTYVSPYNDPDVIAGQGTIGVEIESQCEDLDTIIISVGGGGLVGGIAIYLKSIWPQINVIGGSPENSAVMMHSVSEGRILNMQSKPTLSDGTAGGVEEDSITFPICKNMIDKFVLVNENEIKDAMIDYIKNEHELIEGAAGTAVATLLKMKDDLKGSKVGVIICGGNISLETLRKILK